MINNVSSIESAPSFDTCINADKSLNKDVAAIVINANPARRYAAFINNSNVDITLILGESNQGSIGKGIILKPRGGSYEIDANNLYVGRVCAISAVAVKLSYVECS